MSKD
jgi:hypothetical protein